MAKSLTYSDYINDYGIVQALRIPQPPPGKHTEATWPMWHPPNEEGNGVAWSPGEPWPHGANWCHEEVLFIRVHQAFEVWFSVVLHEVGEVVQRASDRCEVEGAALQRVDLSKRVGAPPVFSPHRFPKLARVMRSARQPFLQYRHIPSPGYYFVATPGLAGVEPTVLYEWTALIRRAAAAMGVTVPFFDVLRTMTPHQFLQFRDRLDPASGFGSTQFRELELLFGLRESLQKRLSPDGGTREPHHEGELPIPEPMLRPGDATPRGQANLSFYKHHRPEDWKRLAQRFRSASLRDIVYNLLNTNLLHARGLDDADEALDDFASHVIEETINRFREDEDESFAGALFDEIGQVLAHRETITAARIGSEPGDDEKGEACLEFLNACLDLDAALLRWRDTHIRFVESMIGKRPGTGGGGVNYLRGTTDAGLAASLTHAFPCLWQARSIVRNSA